jgi:hypothetical protein
LPSSNTAQSELVVPKSIPTIRDMSHPNSKAQK